MDYKKCPHYNEIFEVLSKGLSLEDVSFEIDTITDCPECKNDGSVCSLWVYLSFADQVSDQVGIYGPEVTIDKLDERIKEISWGLVNSHMMSKREKENQ